MMLRKNTAMPESFIGIRSSFKGEIASKRALRVDGIIEGNIAVDCIVIGERARINGNIHARGVVVGGRVEGNIHAEESVKIENKGQVIGGVHTPNLFVSKGARFDGRSVIFPKS